MSYEGPKAFRDAVAELAKLPGVGEKTAQRLVFYLLRTSEIGVASLVTSLQNLKSKLSFCATCWGLAEGESCPICKDAMRNHDLLCVVEEPSDLFAIERSGQYRGVYHVLHGRLAPLDGITPDRIKIAALMERVTRKPPREVVLATNTDVEGEATALYIAKLLKEKGVVASRIAMGIPMGGHLEYSDHVTLGRAISERRSFGVT